MLDPASADDDEESDAIDGLTVVRVDTVVRSVTVVMVVNSVTVDSAEDKADEGETDEGETDEDDADDTATVTVWAAATVVLSVTTGW